jgi:transcriptional regulator with XRE-family HTH domain
MNIFIIYAFIIESGGFMPETLQEYVRRLMYEKNLSGYDIARQSGNQIHQTSVSRLINRQGSNPTITTLKALAKGLGVPEHEIMTVARGHAKKTNIVHERLAAIDFAYDGMPRQKKEKAEYLIEMLEREIDRMKTEKE